METKLQKEPKRGSHFVQTSYRSYKINTFLLVTYSYACRNIVNTIKTSGHSSLKKYTSHFIRKGYERVIV